MEGEIVCVTGASGFIGSWLVMRLLEQGYFVRATVRDPENMNKVKHLLDLPKASTHLSLWRGELVEEGSFDDVIQGCTGVFHVATPMDFSVDRDPEEMNTWRTIGIAEAKEGSYIRVNPHITSTSFTKIAVNTTHTNFNIWHYRLGHPSASRLSVLHSSCPFITISNNNCHACDICHLAKQRKLSFPISDSKSLKPFELVHVNIWGPFSIVLINGFKYFLTVVDDYSRYTWVFLMKSKSKTRNHLQSFIQMAETQFDAKVKAIRSDNGSEFSMSDFYAQKEILHQTTCIETPQQNAIIERKHQHILNVARALLFQFKLAKLFWSYSILHVVFLINRLPTPLLQNKSPFHLLYLASPDYL
ncbi:retrovirus-related Pol polyprotein from transposon RE2 isoform X1 [Hevea brasiliensis]|uniref:retrovirus-related Pol polyprotein from transposon RE2 isoform X1 n=1 Tax=Hevea brasiliensis TaxID=3981 RepID=UPI0025D5006F|nr:retrovirus-related Pol polyprotein from transposon RE2 isoform X1 [Hevea brasiliensis]